MQASETYVDVANWLPINKNIDLDTQHSIKLPKTTFYYVRTWPIMCKNGRGQTGKIPVDNLRAPGEIRLFRPSRSLKKIYRLLLKFADIEPILCITDQTNEKLDWLISQSSLTLKMVRLEVKPGTQLLTLISPTFWKLWLDTVANFCEDKIKFNYQLGSQVQSYLRTIEIFLHHTWNIFSILINQVV